MDANKVTADTLSRTPNTQRYNANTIFTSENLYKLDELVDMLKYLTINYAEYYVSNSATANGAKGDHAINPSIVTHIFSNSALLVVVPTMNLSIEDKIVPIGGGVSNTLSACNEGGCHGHGVRRRLGQLDSATSKLDRSRWKHPRQHWYGCKVQTSSLPSYDWNSYHFPTPWAQRELASLE